MTSKASGRFPPNPDKPSTSPKPLEYAQSAGERSNTKTKRSEEDVRIQSPSLTFGSFSISGFAPFVFPSPPPSLPFLLKYHSNAPSLFLRQVHRTPGVDIGGGGFFVRFVWFNLVEGGVTMLFAVSALWVVPFARRGGGFVLHLPVPGRKLIAGLCCAPMISLAFLD